MNRKKSQLLQLLKDYRFNSILVRNFFMILATLFCSFMVIMGLVSSELNESTQKQVRLLSGSQLSSVSAHIDNIMNEAVQIAARLSLDDDIMSFLLADISDYSVNYEETFQAKKKLEQYFGIFSYIDSIYIYSSKSRYILTNTEGGPVDSFEDLTWYDNLTERIYEPARMISRLKYGTYPYLISYLQPVRLTQMQFLGGIIINIDANKISQYSTGSSESFFIIDARDNVIFSSDESYQLEKWSQLPYALEYDEKGEETQIIQVEGEDLILSVASSDKFNWKYAALVPLEKYQYYRLEMRGFLGVFLVFIVILSVAGALLTSVYSYNPVRNIISLVKDPAAYAPRMTGGFRKDETQEIIQNIVHNFYSNNELQEDLKEYLAITNRAQIAALQAQISPHFLYNTLENIRWQAIALGNGDNDVARIILKLSELLRLSLDNEHEIISIAEEVKNAQIYVDIIQLRYQNKLTVEWKIPPEVSRCQIVKVSLQPLIENAVTHGIKPKRGQGVIVVSAWREDEMAYVEVADNGSGMSQEDCAALNRDLNEMYTLSDNHIGVRNVNQRLKLLLGESSGIQVISSPGRGARFIMRFPFCGIKEEKEEAEQL